MPTLHDNNSAALFLRISPRTLDKLRVRGGGPEYFKAGARVIYSEADLLAWLDASRRRSTSDRGVA